jgi:hypothetical protein
MQCALFKQWLATGNGAVVGRVLAFLGCQRQGSRSCYSRTHIRPVGEQEGNNVHVALHKMNKTPQWLVLLPAAVQQQHGAAYRPARHQARSGMTGQAAGTAA